MNEKAAHKKNPQQIAEELSKIVSGRCMADIFNRVALSTDASIYQIIPVCVVAVKDQSDVCAVVKYAYDNQVSISARGAGSGLAGESLICGIMLDTTKYMNKIINTSSDGSLVTCQPGVVLDSLNRHLAVYGRKIGPDPSSANRAVIGGVVANNATGSHSLCYGYIAEYIEKIKAVLADGRAVEFVNDFDPEDHSDSGAGEISKNCFRLLTANTELIQKVQPATKRNHSGYNIASVLHDGKIDMAKLLAGSEGTLAVFTEITLRTVSLPKLSAVVQLEFDCLDKMAKAVPIIVDCGASACELMDGNLVQIARQAFVQYRDILNPSSAASLLAEHTADSKEQLKSKIEETIAAVEDFIFDKEIVYDPIQQKRLFTCRKDAVPLLSRTKGLKQPVAFIEDVSVDNKKLAEYIIGLQQIGKNYDVDMTYYGHAGDGELHIRPYLDLSNPADVEKMKKIADDVFSLALSLGGSISGEHADGLVRAGFMEKQFGKEYCRILKGIKNIFDPTANLNPNKIITDNADLMVQDLRGKNKILNSRAESKLNFKPDEFKFELLQCNGCGVCRAGQSTQRMCPVFAATSDELYSARGRANLMAAWAKGILTDEDFESEEFKKIISTCLNCKACFNECPAGVDVSKMIIEARAKLAAKNGLPKTAKVLSLNRYMSMLGSAFGPISNFVVSFKPAKFFMQLLLGIDKRRQMPKFGFGSFIKKANKYLVSQPKLKNPIDKVAYFTDTFVNYNDHELGFAVIKFLRANNIEVIIPPQRPAPMPAVVYGDVKTSRSDLRYNVKHLAEAIKDGCKIICSEPSSALCLKDDLRFFDDSDNAKLVSENTFEIFEYLGTLLERDKLKPAENKTSEKFAYHAPCHLLAMEKSPASMEVLKELAGIEPEQLNAGCCGIAGTFGMQKKNYELSMKIGKPLAEKIEKSNTNIILTECSTCKMQIEHMTNKKCEHPIKILAKSFNLL